MRRRLWAFIVLAFTMIVGVFTGTRTAIKGINSGLELSNGVQFVYEVSDPNSTEDVNLDDVVSEMERRLGMADVPFYEIETEGKDQVRVSIGGKDSNKLSEIKKLLRFNSDLSLCTTSEVCYSSKDIFGENAVAEVKYVNQYPIVVFPIASKANLEILCEEAQRLSDGAEEGGSESLLILWAGKTESDSYADASDTENPDYKKIQEKVLLSFSSVESELYYDSTHTSIAKTVSYKDNDGNEIESPTALQVRYACEEAQAVVNYFNAGKTEYDIEFKYEQIIDAKVDNLIVFSSNTHFNFGSKIFLGCAIAILLITLLMILSYGWSTIVAAISVSSGMTLTTLLFNLFKVEFGVGAVVGLVGAFILFLASNIVVFEKVKDEAYKGRTLKKANSEGNKRATLIIVDMSIVIMCLSIFSFFIGGGIIKQVAMMFIGAALANITVVLLSNKFLLWFLCNDYYLQTKKHAVLMIKDSKVPNTLNEEKQSYFGKFDGKNFTKGSTSVGILSALVTIVSAVLMIVLPTTNYDTFNYGNGYDSYNRIQIQVEEDSKVTENVNKEFAKFKDELSIGEITFATETDESSDVTVTYYYYTAIIKEMPSATSSLLNNPIYDPQTGVLDMYATIEENIYDLIKTTDSDAKVKVLNVQSTTHIISFGNVFLGVGLGLILACLYLLIRYGISKALSALLVSEISSFLTIGLFVITRLTFTDITVVSCSLIGALSLILSIFLFSREKELSIDEKVNEPKANMIKSVNTSFDAMKTLFLSLFVISFAFAFFGPKNYSIVFFAAGMGSLFALVFNTSFNSPLYLALRKLFGKITLPERKKKKKEVTIHKSAEPEEAIFIGIND
ncbi:MAG: hypothetical protein HUJ61_00960 [Bacilli bacterium]|nr:hypothetical protein [Bacilli bacterium]